MPEPVMSNAAHMCIGHQGVPGAAIEHLCLCLRCLNQEGNLTKSGTELGTTLVNWLNGRKVALARHGPDPAIMERVFNTVTFSCTDPRDRIIALVGMASDV